MLASSVARRPRCCCGSSYESPRDASNRVRSATELGPRRTLTGEHLPPRFEAVAAAQVSGTISPEHARVIADTIDELPAAIRSEHEDGVQTFLLGQAQVFDPHVLAQLADRLRSTLDQDGALAEEHDRARRRELTVSNAPTDPRASTVS